MMSLNSLLNPNTRVKIDFYRDGCLWYSTQNGFQFPVETKNIPFGKSLSANGKATDFEYWIKKEYFKHKSLDK